MDEYATTKDAENADAQLLEVIAICGPDCKPALLAQAWMYIGLVKGGGAKDWDTAREAFSVALGFDEKVQLDPRFFSPTAQALFDGIRGQHAEGDPAKVEPRFEPGTQMGCWPLVQEVEVFRPIPVSCSTRVQGVDGVVLRYREYGDESWTRVDLKKEGEAWLGQIPCTALGRPGTWGMYVEAKDQRDNTVERIGSRDRPLVFKVVEESDLPPPSLPGEAPPDKCIATTYCPEEMIGTPACDQLQGGAAPPPPSMACEESSECDLGMTCQEGRCKAPKVCTRDSDCGEDACQAGLCTERERPAKMDWFGVHFGADLTLLSGATDVCREQAAGFACYDGSEPYVGTPYTDNGGAVAGGPHLGTLRAMLSYERFLLDNVSLGVRFGFAFSGAPEDFLPLHFEGRGTYYFSDVTRGQSTFVPYLALGAGVAQVDSRAEVEMVDCLPDAVADCLAAPAVNESLIDRDGDGPDDGAARLRTLDAYKSFGTVFGTVSPGLMLALSRELSAVVNLGVLLMTEEGSSSSLIVNFQPTLGLALGF